MRSGTKARQTAKTPNVDCGNSGTAVLGLDTVIVTAAEWTREPLRPVMTSW